MNLTKTGDFKCVVRAKELLKARQIIPQNHDVDGILSTHSAAAHLIEMLEKTQGAVGNLRKQISK